MKIDWWTVAIVVVVGVAVSGLVFLACFDGSRRGKGVRLDLGNLGLLISRPFRPLAAPVAEARDVEPTPGVDGEPEEAEDADRPTNPASVERVSANPEATPIEVLRAMIRAAHVTADLPLLYGAGYAPEEPDEDVDDADSGDGEPQAPNLDDFVDAPRPEAPVAVEPEPSRVPYVIQGAPTEPAAIYGAIQPVGKLDSGVMRVGWGNTGTYPLVEGSALADQQERSEASRVLTDAEGDPVSETFDYGPLQRYEVTWMSGHVETVQAHQVTWPQQGVSMARGMLGLTTEQNGRSRVQMHAEIDGHWRLTLSALEEDIRTIRLATDDEPVPTVPAPPAERAS